MIESGTIAMGASASGGVCGGDCCVGFGLESVEEIGDKAGEQEVSRALLVLSMLKLR